MSPIKSELTIKVEESGIKLEVDTFSLLLTEKDIRTLIRKLQDSLFELHNKMSKNVDKPEHSLR